MGIPCTGIWKNSKNVCCFEIVFFFLSEVKPPKTLLHFFENPLSEAYLYFIHSQASVIHFQILKVEGRSKPVIEVLEVLETTLADSEHKLSIQFLPYSVRTI